MVFVRLLGVLVLAEAFASQVVVVVDTPAAPVAVAFDAEVVVRLACQFAPSGTRFQQALCQCDTGGYAIFLLVGDGDVAILFDIFFIRRNFPVDGSRKGRCEGE